METRGSFKEAYRHTWGFTSYACTMVRLCYLRYNRNCWDWPLKLSRTFRRHFESFGPQCSRVMRPCARILLSILVFRTIPKGKGILGYMGLPLLHWGLHKWGDPNIYFNKMYFCPFIGTPKMIPLIFGSTNFGFRAHRAGSEGFATCVVTENRKVTIRASGFQNRSMQGRANSTT